MKNILLPTDFSACAKNATYAALDKNYIEKRAIDFVVIGSHGASGRKEFFLGSNL